MENVFAPENRFWRGCCLLVRRYLHHRVAVQGAALAFYLLFMIFPFLIFISALLGLLHLDVAGVLESLQEFLPRQIVAFLGAYLSYVTMNPSVRLMVFGLVFSFYFPMRAANSLMRSVRTAYHLGPPRGVVAHWAKTLLYTVMLISAVALTLTLMTVGERALWYAVEQLRLPVFAAELWVRLRFPVVALVGYFALFFLYALPQDRRQPWRNIWPGTLFSLVAWVGSSALYAFYVDRAAQYSRLYGSIGTVIVVLIWLNMSAIILIMGAELNGVLISLRRDTQALRE